MSKAPASIQEENRLQVGRLAAGDNYKERYDGLARIAPQWLWSTNEHAILTECSDRCLPLFGLHPAELIGLHVSDIFQPVSWQVSASPPLHRQTFPNQLYGLQGRGGHRCLVKAAASPIYDKNTGRFRGLQGIADTRLDSNELGQALKNLFRLIEQGMALALIIDQDNRIRFANQRLIEFFGYAKAELRSLRYDSLLGPTETPRQQSKKTKDPSWIQAETKTYRNRRGELRRVFECASALTIPGDDRSCFLHLGFDDTAERAFRLLPGGHQSSEDLLLEMGVKITHCFAVLAPHVNNPFDFHDFDARRLQAASEQTADNRHIIAALPRRQREVLHLLAAGHSNKAIGRQLGIAEATVKTHLRAICESLGVKNRVQAAVAASHLDS